MASRPTQRTNRTPAQITAAAFEALTVGGGQVAERVREVDWVNHPLGTPDKWPQSLRTMVRVMLSSRFQMWLGWGDGLYFFYNDAYAPTLGLKKAWALGSRADKVWSEIWSAVGPRIDGVITTGKATWDEGLMLLLERNGYPEETYHTFSYSPIPDDDGSIGGMFCTVTEETDRIIGERRMEFLRSLGTKLVNDQSEGELLKAITTHTGDRSPDLPFALLYLFSGDEKTANLAMAIGTEIDPRLAPAQIELTSAVSRWPAKAILESPTTAVIENFSDGSTAVPAGPWDKPPRHAAIVPVAQPGQTHPAAFSLWA